MGTTTIATHELSNGLILQFIDESKKIAADRWYVCIAVSIRIPVDIKWFTEGSLGEGQFNCIVGVLGPEVLFRQKKERNFVSDAVKEQVVQQMCERTLATGSDYLGSRSFAAKYILKTYAERSRQQPA